MTTIRSTVDWIDAQWPNNPTTATVERVFKNGTVAVALDHVRNFSDDGRKTVHVPSVYLARS